MMPSSRLLRALEAYGSYYVMVSLPQWTKGYSLERSFITQVRFKFSSNMKVIIMTKAIYSQYDGKIISFFEYGYQ